MHTDTRSAGIALQERLRRLAAAAAVAEEAAVDAREVRDAEIEQADLAGLPIRAIARITGLSAGRTQQIINARTAARQAATARQLRL